MAEHIVEYLGYLAALLVAISITIKGGVYFRIFNMVGSLCFLLYGLFLHAWPVAIINAYGIGINVFHLVKLLKGNKRPGTRPGTVTNGEA